MSKVLLGISIGLVAFLLFQLGVFIAIKDVEERCLYKIDNINLRIDTVNIKLANLKEDMIAEDSINVKMIDSNSKYWEEYVRMQDSINQKLNIRTLPLIGWRP
jgi:hypothetical protein